MFRFIRNWLREQKRGEEMCKQALKDLLDTHKLYQEYQTKKIKQLIKEYKENERFIRR